MSILEWDSQLLVNINAMNSEIMDTIMWIISGKLTWLPLYLLLIGIIVYQYKNQKFAIGKISIPVWLFVIVGFAISVGLSDFVSSGILKPMVGRLRPTHNPDISSLLHIVHNYRGGEYGFPSSHASNTFAVATLFACVFKPKNKWSVFDYIGIILLFIWALLNCYSRMYMGVHYPIDIFAGAILGILISLCVYKILELSILKR